MEHGCVRVQVTDDRELFSVGRPCLQVRAAQTREAGRGLYFLEGHAGMQRGHADRMFGPPKSITHNW